MTDTMKQVADNLEAAGVETRIWEAGKGRLLISAHGGRVLRCEINGVEGNLFFHPNALLDRDKAAEFVSKRKAMIGGDRLWIAPENGYHFTDLEKARVAPFENYKVPADVDPGDWTITFEAADIAAASMWAKAKLTDYRNDKTIELTITREFNAVEDYAPSDIPDDAPDFDLHFRTTNGLRITGGDDGAVAGAWGILQVPAGGVLICPTNKKVDGPRSYYDDYDAHHVIEKNGAVRIKLDGKKRIKIGLSPAQTNGRMGYYRKVGDVHTMVVRLFEVRAEDKYIDLPRSTDDIFGGDALQSYNDNAGPQSFGEMEYHDPAVVVGETDAQNGFVHTLVFAGSESHIAKVCDKWLGVPLKD